MKISTKFNLCVGLFFVFVFMAVFYSYCGGLSVCYSFPFLNGIRSGSASKAKVLMTSYIIDAKGESRDHGGNTIYFYSKVKGEPQLTKEITRKPSDENDTRKKTGSNIRNPPSDITGKAALDILRKSNVSLEEANRELFREEKVDKQVDREDLIKAKPIPTQSSPIKKIRGGLGLRFRHPRVHPIRKPPRRMRKKLRKNRINRFSKQDRIDRALEKKLEKAEVVTRMRGYGPGNESFSSNTSQKAGKKVKKWSKMNANQSKEENFINEAVSPLDIIKYRNEAHTFKRPHNDEAAWRNTSISPKFRQNLKIDLKNFTSRFENKKSMHKNLSNKRKEISNLKKGLMPKKDKEIQVISEQKYNTSRVKTEHRNKTFSNETGIGSHGNSMTSLGKVNVKGKKVDEGSGSDDGSGVSKGQLVQSIRNINDHHIKLALQYALDKDEQRLKNDVMRIKTSIEQNYRPFNLTKVLRELVTVAETDSGRESFPGTHFKENILLKRRNSDWDRPLVRVKRLGKIRRRNDKSERTLVRVKRIEEEPEESNDAGQRLANVPKEQKAGQRLLNVPKKAKLTKKFVGFPKV